MNATRISFKAILCGIIAALLALSLASVLLPTQSDFDPSNPYWNGHLKLFMAVNMSVLNVEVYKPDPRATVLFVVGPTLNITEERVNVWRRYAEEGGTLVLMDETSSVNYALKMLGLPVRVNGHPMLDTVFYYNGWRIPKIIDVGESMLTRNVSVIVMDVPSVLDVTGGGLGLRVLAYSSSFSFLDLDGDGSPSSGEPVGPFPVAVEVPYGRGRVIVFSDSSLFINGVIELGDNLQLLRNIVGDRVLILDSGVLRKSFHSEVKDAVLLVHSFISLPEIKYSLTLAALLTIYLLVRRGGRPEEYEEVDRLVARYPSWDRRLLKMLREARSKVGH